MPDISLDRIARGTPDSLVGLIYDCVLRDDLLRTLLERVANHFGAASTVLVYVDPVNAIAAFSLAYGVLDDPAVQLRYNRDFAAIDPAPAAMAGLKPGQAASTDLVFANSMDRCSPFIEGFLHPIGIGGCLAGVVAQGGGTIGFFAVHRHRERRIFDESDVAAFEDILHHVVRMLNLRRTFYGLTAQIEARSHGLDQVSVGIMLFGEDRQLIQANTASRAILARDDGLSMNRLGMLTARDSQANEAIGAAFLRRDEAIVVVVPRRDAPLPYVLRFSFERAAGGSEHRAISIWDPDHESGDPSTLIRQAFGLTASSAKLVSALLRGETLDVYAASNNLSRSTAKFHLNAAFAATGTRRQGELVRLAGSLVHALAPAKPN